MQARLYTTVVALLVAILSYSQEFDVAVQPDSANTEGALVTSGILSPRVFSRLYSPYISPSESVYGVEGDYLRVSPNFYDPDGVMPRIGGLGGYVTSASLPGLMGIESGALSYSLVAGNFSFTPAVYVNKYGYFGGLTTSLGVGGQMEWRVNDRFSLTAFGSYHTNSWAANPAVMANMLSSRFGGYATWHIDNRWGLNVGAQRVYNSALNQWQTVPIVMPTFKINGKDAIGIDVGGLLYQIVDWNRQKNSFSPGNPTIGPPAKPQIVVPPHK